MTVGFDLHFLSGRCLFGYSDNKLCDAAFLGSLESSSVLASSRRGVRSASPHSSRFCLSSRCSASRTADLKLVEHNAPGMHMLISRQNNRDARATLSAERSQVAPGKHFEGNCLFKRHGYLHVTALALKVGNGETSPMPGLTGTVLSAPVCTVTEISCLNSLLDLHLNCLGLRLFCFWQVDDKDAVLKLMLPCSAEWWTAFAG